MNTRTLLLCGGVYHHSRCLDWLRQGVARRRPDVLLFVGGVLDRARAYAARTSPWDLTRDDALFLERFFRTLGELGVFTAVIPGPADSPLDDFLRLGMNAEVEFPTLHLAHATRIEKGDVVITGMGGNLVEGPACERELISRTLAEYHLRKLADAKQPHKVLLLPAPPAGPLGGTSGNALVGDLIDSCHPNLCVVAGPNESRGTQRLAHTLVVNPGCLADGRAAWLDWTRPADEQVEWLDLRHPERTGVPSEMGAGD